MYKVLVQTKIVLGVVVILVLVVVNQVDPDTSI